MTEEQAKFLYLIADSIGTTAIEDFSCKAGEKMREIIKALEQSTSDDCVSKAEVLKQIKEWRDCEFVKMTNPYHYLEKRIQSMSPVTPAQCIAAVRFSKDDLREICKERIEIECTHGTCKDCKHYVGASMDNIYKTNYCRKHDKNVYREDFYCADFEKRSNENETCKDCRYWYSDNGLTGSCYKRLNITRHDYDDHCANFKKRGNEE